MRQLVQPEQHVAESKAFIAAQQRVMVESERGGRDWTEAIGLWKLSFCSSDREGKTALEFSMSFLSRRKHHDREPPLGQMHANTGRGAAGLGDC